MNVAYGRYWIRTSDPFRVKEVRYRCANRPIPSSYTVAVPCPRPAGCPRDDGLLNRQGDVG